MKKKTYFKTREREKFIKGVIDGNVNGYAFLVADSGEPDYFIGEKDLNGAYHGDRVLAKEKGSRRIGGKHAKVVKIIERGIETLVGTYKKGETTDYVIPDERKFSSVVLVDKYGFLTAENFDKVVVKIDSYSKNGVPKGKITDVLGKRFDRETEIKSIAVSNSLHLKFPKEVLKEADKIEGVTERDLNGRKDLREDLIITIDGDDSKDFDDAVSLKILGNGNYLLGVHIADVTHYVKYQGEIDREAFKRGTSVYFPENVLPMLPNKLSDDVCSLVEGKDRLTLSCIMEIDGNGNRVKSEIKSSVIRSKARMTYKKVAAILNGDKELSRRYAFLVDMLKNMDSLAKILLNKRNALGNVDLDIKEAEIKLVGENIDVCARERLFSHRIIEEFMICANEAVAEFAVKRKLPFVYRIHETPSEEKLNKLSDYLTGLSIGYKWSEPVVPKDFQRVLIAAENTPYSSKISKVMLRSMQKAKYSPIDVGHFGLASAHYSHFTSPIRRYADLTIHRVLKEYIKHGVKSINKYGEYVKESSVRASETEKRAEEAERAVDDYYKILFMKDRLGEEFEGIISGVTPFGIFVELESTVEGIVKTETLEGSGYEFDEKNLVLENGVKRYRFGDKVKVKAVGIDYAKRRTEFVLS